MTKEESLLSKRFVDLSRQAQQKDIVLFSDFLNLNELNIFHQGINQLYCRFDFLGGYEQSERQMIAFLPDALCYAYHVPICCIKITPINCKFADALSHRDVLGSLMNLGIERNLLGDIWVEEHLIYVFCQEKIASYIIDNLTRIRHTVICCEKTIPNKVAIVPKTELLEGIVASNRLDSIVACLCKISRSKAKEWIQMGKVFINNKEILHATYECKEEVMISIRMVGRFKFRQALGETRKGRMKIQYEKYI